MKRENTFTPEKFTTPQTETSGGQIPPRTIAKTAIGLVDDIPQVFKDAFRREELDPKLTIVRSQPQHEQNMGTSYLFHTNLYEN